MFFVLSIGTPVYSAHAWSFSSLWTKSITADTVSDSEAQNSQTIDFLEAATNVDPKKAMGGGDITVVDDSALLPDVGPSGTIADIESDKHQGKISLYIVRRGDSFSQIAKMFDVSISTILWANGLTKKDSLREGQTLVILPIDGVQYTVKKGDTIQGIAKKYKGDVDDILAFNDLENGATLSVGDTLIIPDAEEASAPTESKPSVIRSSRTASYPSYKGYYTHPVPSGIRSQGLHGYNGVDYGAPIGSPVLSAADGVVIVSKFRTSGNTWFGGYGNSVIIEHPNGTQTLYGHMSTVFVPIGAKVSKGQIIGEVGNTGRSTGPHLHFEVRGAKNPF